MFIVLKRKFLSNIYQHSIKIRFFTQFEPQYDVNYLLDKQNYSEIDKNIRIRKGIGNIQIVHQILDQLKQANLSESNKKTLKESLQSELKKIPNKTHPKVVDYFEPKEINKINLERKFEFKPKTFYEITKSFNNIRMEHLGNIAGHKSYYLTGQLADLKQALINYTLECLLKHKFELITVPDILPEHIIESCGMSTTGERSQVYRLEPTKMCLSGTSEMALAGFFTGKTLEESELPIKLTAISRCFRAETSGLQEEKGLYRVHQFTKVEMFSVCKPQQSEKVLEEIKDIQIELFQNLGLHFKILDMPPFELAKPAYRKYDIEALLHGKGKWGEISSCSDCTDYQSRRLNIRFKNKNSNNLSYVHTVNGTACAIPRMLVAILEHFQNPDLTVSIPNVLHKYLSFDKMTRKKDLPELKLVKNIPHPSLFI